MEKLGYNLLALRCSAAILMEMSPVLALMVLLTLRCSSKQILENPLCLQNLLNIQNCRLRKPSKRRKNTIGKWKHRENSEKQSNGGLNNECTTTVRYGQSMVHIWSEKLQSTQADRGYWRISYMSCDCDQQSQWGPSIKCTDRWPTLYRRITIGQHNRALTKRPEVIAICDNN